ncbi:nascent polypeptide-associated complex subunit alpha, muscle-specific form-like isoform X6 [Alosa sapidissima]|uniref:nascent polypeptide-associated complex subunit alpha, muscle-specific form-like isoform X6 n=1 Tax=Alosa sapidissima TaxID=34773 RepID=UPI001C080ED4|nr:nascent polypeptide-associated complex subunit alpha, muscle-specific form-like isoform X6 [Alosa sapidissima]
MACHVTGRSAYPDNWRSVVGQRSPGQWHQGDCGSPQYYKVDPKDCRGFLGVQDNNDPPKSEVMAFLKGKALECLRDLSVEDRCSAYLCWQLTALLCQMNGNVTGNDIAELLLCKETAKLRQEEESTVYDLVDIDGKAKRRAKGTLSVKAVDVSKPGDWSAASQRFRQLLCAGRAKEALEYAVQKALWGHAFRLASRMGTTELQRVVARFADSMEEGDPLRTLYQIESGRIPDVATRCGENWYTHLASVLTAVCPKDLRITTAKMMGESLRSKGMMEASHFCFVAAQIQVGTLYKVPLKVEIDPDQRTPLVLEATKVPLAFKKEVTAAKAEDPTLADMEASVPISAGPAQVPIPAPMTITVPLGKVKQSYADHYHLNNETGQCIKTTLSAQEVKAVSPAPDVEAAQSQSLIEQKLLKPAADSVTGTPSLRGVNTVDPGKMEAVSPPVTAAFTKDDAPSFKQEETAATAEVPPLADMEASVPISAGPAQVPIPAPMTITVPLGKVKQSYADHYHLNRPRRRYVDVFATSELTVQVAPPNMLDLMAPMAIPDLIEHQDETGQCIKKTLSAQEVKAVSPAPDVEAAQSQPLIEQKLLEPAADSVTGTPSLRGVNTVDPGKMEAVSPPVTAASTKDDAPSFKQEVMVATAEVPPLADMEASVPISAGPAQVPIPAPMTITVPLGKVKQSYADHYHLNNETGQCIKTTLPAQEVKAVSPAPDVEAAQSQPLIEQKLLEPAADSVTGTPSLRGVNTVDPGKMEAVSPPVTAASTKDDAPSFKQERAATAEDPPLADMEASMPASAGPAQVPIPAPMTITVPLGKVKQSYADHDHLNRPRGRYVDVFATSELTVQVAPPNMLDLMAPMAIPDLIEHQDETGQCIKTTLSAQEVMAVSPAPDVEAAQSQPLIEQKLLEPAADSVTGTPSLRGVNTVDPGKMEAVSPPVTAASTKDDAPSFKQEVMVATAEVPPLAYMEASVPISAGPAQVPIPAPMTITITLGKVKQSYADHYHLNNETGQCIKTTLPSQEVKAVSPALDVEAAQSQPLIEQKLLEPAADSVTGTPSLRGVNTVDPGKMEAVSPPVTAASTKDDAPSFKQEVMVATAEVPPLAYMEASVPISAGPAQVPIPAPMTITITLGKVKQSYADHYHLNNETGQCIKMTLPSQEVKAVSPAPDVEAAQSQPLIEQKLLEPAADSVTGTPSLRGVNTVDPGKMEAVSPPVTAASTKDDAPSFKQEVMVATAEVPPLAYMEASVPISAGPAQVPIPAPMTITITLGKVKQSYADHYHLNNETGQCIKTTLPAQEVKAVSPAPDVEAAQSQPLIEQKLLEPAADSVTGTPSLRGVNTVDPGKMEAVSPPVTAASTKDDAPSFKQERAATAEDPPLADMEASMPASAGPAQVPIPAPMTITVPLGKVKQSYADHDHLNRPRGRYVDVFATSELTVQVAPPNMLDVMAPMAIPDLIEHQDETGQCIKTTLSAQEVKAVSPAPDVEAAQSQPLIEQKLLEPAADSVTGTPSLRGVNTVDPGKMEAVSPPVTAASTKDDAPSFKQEVMVATAEVPPLAYMEASVPISAGPAQVPIPAPMTITITLGKVKQSYADHYHLNNETGQCIKTTLPSQEVKAVSPAPDVEAAQSQPLIEQKLLEPAADSVTGTPSLRGVNTVDPGKMEAVSPPVTAASTKDDAPSFKQEVMVATAEVPPLADMEASVPISAGPAQVPIPAPMTITVPLGKVKQSYADHYHLNNETGQCIKTTLPAQEVKAVSPAPDVEAAQSQPLIEQKLLEPAADSVTGTPSLRGVNTVDPGKMEAVSPPVTAASTKDDAPSFKERAATAEDPPLADMEASMPASAGPAQVPIPAPMTITVPLGKVKQSYADHDHLNRPRGRYVDVFATSELTVQVAPPNMLDVMAPMAIPDLIEHQDETGQCIKTTLSAQEVMAVSPAPDVEAAQSQPLIEQKLLEPAADSVTGTPSLRGVNTVDPGKMEAVSPPVTAASTKDDAPSFKQEVMVATAEVPPLADMEASVPISAGPAQVPIPAPMTITVTLGKVKQSYADHYHLNNETGQCIKTTLPAQEVKAVSPAPDVEAAQSQPLIEQKLLEPAADSVTGTPSLRGVNTVDPGKMEPVSPPVTAASTKDDAPSFKQEETAATAEDPPLADMEAPQLQTLIDPLPVNTPKQPHVAPGSMKAVSLQVKTACTKNDELSFKRYCRGWLSWIIPRKKEAHLPDDKNKSIFWDESKQKWVDRNEPEEKTKAVPPPPMGPPLMPPRNTGSPTGSGGPSTALSTNGPPVNMFRRIGNKNRYVDIMKPSGDNTKPLESFVSPSMLTLWTPVVKTNIFNPAQVSAGDMVESVTQPCPPLAELSRPPTETETVHDPA